MSNYLQVTSVIIVVKYNGKYLLVQRALEDDIFPGKWQNMGGKVELGKNLEDAIRREVEEEVGFTLADDFQPVFVQSYSWKKDESAPYRLGVIFLVNLNTKPKVNIDDELNDYGWFSLEELEKLDTIGPASPTGTLAQVKLADKMPSKRF